MSSASVMHGELQTRVGIRAATRAPRILHVLDHSLPEQSGYAFRSHAILLSLQRLGLEIDAVTGPKHGAPVTAAEESIESVSYLRTPADAPLEGVGGQLRTILATRRRVRDRLRQHEVALLHAHSPCLNGLAVAGLGRPLVYEMRSSWEDAAVSSGTTTEGSLRYRLSRWLETAVLRRADAVVVICEGLRRELIARGLPAERITIVPNALPDAMFETSGRDRGAELRQTLGLAGKRVIGFFGSFFEWEGVDSLVRVMPAVLAAIPEAQLLLAGGGRQEPVLRELVRKLGLERAVTFAGRVDADRIHDLYGVADLMVYPRVPHRLTDMVTPLKPLEAMARCAAVVASDVGGHRELIRDGETGFLYPAGSEEALARKIVALLGSEARLDDVRRAARAFVERDRRWAVVSQRYLPVYERLLGRPVAPDAEQRS